MKKNFVVVMLFALFCLSVITGSVFADQEGNDRWCNIDDYGCWVTNEENSKDYIMFWSEETRLYFMGDITEPYTNVVDRCLDCTGGKLTLDAPLHRGRGGYTYYKMDGKIFYTGEDLLKYVAQKYNQDSCSFVGDRIECR